VIDATGNPRTILLLGGTSDIGLAIAIEHLKTRPATVILAARPDSERLNQATAAVRAAGGEVHVLEFDAADTASHAAVIDAAWDIADVDLAIVAFGVLGDAEQLWQDQTAAVQAAQVNYTGAVSVGVLLGQKMKAQGYGQIVAISSVAGEVVRRSNFVYGSTKAGFDGFYRLLGQALEPFGPKVLVVRPGFVKSHLTRDMAAAPLAVTPQQVGAAVVAALRQGRTVIRVPAAFGLVMLAFKHLPGPVMKRLPV
jgi:decaprenylphospho-beta-D-erythro-pentofuranosid-2-ulose 2-reductase